MRPIRYGEVAGPGALRPYVGAVWRRWGESDGDGVVHTVPPDGCADLVFDLSPEPTIAPEAGPTAPRAFAVGPMTRPLHRTENSGPVDVVGVRFRPGCAGPFLGVPLDELQDLRVPLDELWDRRAAAWIEPFLAAPAARRPALLAAGLLGRPAAAPSATVAQALAALDRARGACRIDRLARELAISRQALTRRFRREVGIGPKAYGRIVRVEHAVAWLRRSDRDRGASWIAAELGFSDQAHLVREVRALTGRTPSAHRAPIPARGSSVPNLQDATPPGR